MTKEELQEFIEKYNKNIYCEFEEIKQQLKNLHSEKIITVMREREENILFEVYRRSSLIDFSYTGLIKIEWYGEVSRRNYNDSMNLNGIHYEFHQNDTGHFDTFQIITKKFLIPDSKFLEQNDLYARDTCFKTESIHRGEKISRTSNVNSLKKVIFEDIKKYNKDIVVTN